MKTQTFSVTITGDSEIFDDLSHTDVVELLRELPDGDTVVVRFGEGHTWYGRVDAVLPAVESDYVASLTEYDSCTLAFMEAARRLAYQTMPNGMATGRFGLDTDYGRRDGVNQAVTTIARTRWDLNGTGYTIDDPVLWAYREAEQEAVEYMVASLNDAPTELALGYLEDTITIPLIERDYGRGVARYGNKRFRVAYEPRIGAEGREWHYTDVWLSGVGGPTTIGMMESAIGEIALDTRFWLGVAYEYLPLHVDGERRTAWTDDRFTVSNEGELWEITNRESGKTESRLSVEAIREVARQWLTTWGPEDDPDDTCDCGRCHRCIDEDEYEVYPVTEGEDVATDGHVAPVSGGDHDEDEDGPTTLFYVTVRESTTYRVRAFDHEHAESIVWEIREGEPAPREIVGVDVERIVEPPAVSGGDHDDYPWVRMIASTGEGEIKGEMPVDELTFLLRALSPDDYEVEVDGLAYGGFSGPASHVLADVLNHVSPITDARARTVACEWHGGGGSALYALCSTGAVLPDVIDEIERCIASLSSNLATPHDEGYTHDDMADDLRSLRLYATLRRDRGPVPGWADLWQDSPAISGGDHALDDRKPFVVAWMVTDGNDSVSIVAIDGPVDDARLAELRAGAWNTTIANILRWDHIYATPVWGTGDIEVNEEVQTINDLNERAITG